ncbi:MAG: pyridoxamine 5'-phosphate oxidase [Bacteroidales bacterium]|nr:pyridoxamine 5'-phosphate oxidase [Bacteroidales bacterium]
MNQDMEQFRKEYSLLSLSEPNTSSDPFDQFSLWFNEAIDSGIQEPNAMAFATASPDGMPSIRMMLLKAIEADGFVFFTNYYSRKGIHLSNNAKGGMLFFWNELQRQVRIEGKVARTTEEYSDEYFLNRPFESRVGAIISHQSAKLNSREKLEEDFKRMIEDENQTLARPEYWGGFILKPVLFEFWQGREHRLHDRVQYRLKDSVWLKERLAP